MTLYLEDYKNVCEKGALVFTKSSVILRLQVQPCYWLKNLCASKTLRAMLAGDLPPVGVTQARSVTI